MNEKVMVAGHICLDITPRFPGTLTDGLGELVPGRLINVEDAVLGTGGAVSNTGLTMAKLGADVLLGGKIGDDEFGCIIKRIVGEKRALAFKIVANEKTSYSIVLALPGVDRIFLHNPGTNDTFTADDIDYAAAGGCVLFHFGYPPLMKRMYENQGAQIVEMFKRVKQLGVTTSLDMSLPDATSESGRVNWRGILEKALAYVDIFVPSIEEIAFMLDKDLAAKRRAESRGDETRFEPEDYTAMSEELLGMGAKIILFKAGINGCYLRTGSAEKISQLGTASPQSVEEWADRELWVPSQKTEKFGSATGAGDATIAGFLSAFARGFQPTDSVVIANTVGWQNVQAIDTLSGIGDWPRTLELAQDKSRARNKLEINCDGWRYDDKQRAFYGPNDKGGE